METIPNTKVVTSSRELFQMEAPKSSKGSGFLSALGNFLKPVGLAASLINPVFAIPAAIGGGIAYLGNRNASQEMNQVQQNRAADLMQAGYGPGDAGGQAVGYFDNANVNEQVGNILYLRGSTDQAMVHSMN